MSQLRTVAALAGVIALVAQWPTVAEAEQPAGLRSYVASDADFANPERGFSRASGKDSAARAGGHSLMHVYFRLDAYKSRPLPSTFIEEVEQRFVAAERAGVKLVPRFIYNFPAGLPLSPQDTDAPLPMVLKHIDQLGPVLRRNADLIAFLEAGFIGAWGEWHHSTQGLDELIAKKAVLQRLLDVLPVERMVAVRYQRDKKAIFGRTTPLQSTEAFSGADVARVGHHNDCFLASPNDWDTYRPGDAASVRSQKQYLSDENRFVPQAGETCNVAEDAKPFIGCANALPELEALRWSQLNLDYHAGVIGTWRAQGCFDEISRRLGYRLRLTQAALPAAVRRGSPVGGWIAVTNGGFASLYNPRPVELILRHRSSKAEIIVPLKVDPRRWGAGEEHRIQLAERVPSSMPAGTYDLFLNLPDASPRLRPRPEYSIRLANRDMWEAATGYNALGASVQVAPGVGL
jgi:hypothetical protein